jgi:Tfp pilus assembly protein FimT
MIIAGTAPNRNPSERLMKGATLIELITTATIILTIIGTGLPSLSKWLQYQTEITILRSLSHLVTFARTKAVKENQYLTLCASHNRVSCEGEWNKTIIVFNDFNKNETLDNDEILFRIFELAKTTPCLKWNASAGRQYLQFKPSGATNGTAGHFRFCQGVNTAIDKKLVISFNGRTSLKKL